MKKSNIIFIAIVLMLVVVYFISDSKLYYYGGSKYNICNYSLPLGMAPDFLDTRVCWPMKGFVILDNYGTIIIAKDNTYEFNNDTIKIKEFIKYGFDNEHLIAFVEDTKNNYYYIECLKNNNPQSKMELQINVFDVKMKINAETYKWIDVKKNEESTAKLKMIRAYSMLTFIISILIMTLWALILRKIRHIQQD